MSNIYQDIYDHQQKQGNLGGTKSSSSNKSSKSKKVEKKQKKVLFTLIDGIIHKSTDSNGLSDPYLKIKKSKAFHMGKVLAESSVQKKTLRPSWNEDLFFKITDKPGTYVSLELMDKDPISSDLIGRYTFYIPFENGGGVLRFQEEKDGRTFAVAEINYKVVVEKA